MAIVSKQQGSPKRIWRLLFWFLHLRREGDTSRAKKVKTRLKKYGYENLD